MKTKIFISFVAATLGLGALNAAVTVNVPAQCDLTNIDYYYAPIKQFAEATSRSQRGIVTDSVSVVDNQAVINIPDGAPGYLFVLNLKNNPVRFYAAPGEDVNVDVTNCNPFAFTLSGTPLVDGMAQLIILEQPVMQKAQQLNEKGSASEDEMAALELEFTNIQKGFIEKDINAPAVPVALMNLDGEDFIAMFETLQPVIQESILYPLVAQQYKQEKKNLEMEQKQKALQDGSVEAPNFTLKDLEGRDVSLSDFRGKWVILDFWGSWCPWCIKGFPELKEAYQEYAGKLEIIGIDCRESEADWRAGVEKYELSWVNVYNPEGTSLLSEYGVQGFPTKAIIDPEGKIRNITVGHNPAFFTALTDLMAN